MRLSPILFALMVGVISTGAAWAESESQGSVLVTTIQPKRGSLPELATAYGTATSSAEQSRTISLPRGGEIGHLALVSGQAVHRGDTLLDFVTDPATAMGWQQAVSAVALATRELASAKRLLAQRFATQSQVDQAEKALADANATLDSLRRQGADKPHEAVKAPFDSVVTAIAVAQGDRVAANAPLLTLAQGKEIIVIAGIEPDLRTRVGAGGTVELDTISQGDPIQGTVQSIGAQLDPKTRLINVTIAVKDDAVLLGTAYRCRIAIGSFDGWLVPRDAVLTDDKGAYIFQVEQGKAKRIDVKQLGADDDTAALDGAIDPGNPVIVDGDYQLEDGIAVRTGSPAQAP